MNVTLSMEIRNRRNDLGMSQRELAEMTGLSKSCIERIEGESRNPTNETLFKIFQAFSEKRDENSR